MLGEEFKKRLIRERINPEDVLKFATENNKKIRKIITTIVLVDGSEHKLIDDFVWFASRKK